jgi:hypothetical protein
VLTCWRGSDLVVKLGAHFCHLFLTAAPKVLLHHIKEHLVLPMLYTRVAHLKQQQQLVIANASFGLSM